MGRIYQFEKRPVRTWIWNKISSDVTKEVYDLVKKDKNVEIAYPHMELVMKDKNLFKK